MPPSRWLRHVRDHMEHVTGWGLPELSMGMSNDFEIAIEEGATMVRIGLGDLRSTGDIGAATVRDRTICRYP